MECFIHQGVASVARCSQCGKGTCRTCTMTFEGKVFCPQCVHEGGQQEGIRATNENKNSIIAGVVGGVLWGIIALVSDIHVGFIIMLLVPITCFFGGLQFWAYYWGMPRVWKAITGFSFFMFAPIVFWIVFLVVGVYLFLAASLIVGIVRGIKRFGENKKIIINSQLMMEEMEQIAN